MTDRELLEMAAKAAGYPYAWLHGSAWQRGSLRVRLAGPSDDPQAKFDCMDWNPLEDDGAALRLSARLRLAIKPGKHQGDGCSVDPALGETCSVTVFRDSKDMAEQMRHSIVRAAAEIGKAMQEKH